MTILTEVSRTAYVNKDYPCYRCEHEGTTICQSCGTVVTSSGNVHKPSKFEAKYGKKKYDCVVIPKSLKRMVTSIIADTDRRQRAIDMNSVRPEVRDFYVILNTAVNQAMQDLEIGLRQMMFKDFIGGYGYNKSSASPYISANAYYRRKRKVIADVARAMYLI